jgi:hypothetical protein
MMQLVWIDVPGGGFAATVNLSVASLNPNAMPALLEGSFLSYGVDADDNERLLRAERRNDRSDPIMYFNISRDGYGFSKHGYRFTMKSSDGDRFSAESLAVKPMVARAGT